MKKKITKNIVAKIEKYEHEEFKALQAQLVGLRKLIGDAEKERQLLWKTILEKYELKEGLGYRIIVKTREIEKLSSGE